MLEITRDARASYAFFERNWNLMRRYAGWELVFLFYSLASSLSIALIGAGMEQISGQKVDTSFLILYLLTGSLVWTHLSAVFVRVGETISWERWEGTIEYTFMAPISRLAHMLGSSVFSVSYGLLRTSIILVVVSLFFQLDLSRANLVGALMLLLLGSISFIGVGIMVAIMPLMYPEKGEQMVYVVEAALLAVSGVYYPIEILPGWMQAIARFSPATYLLEGMRRALLDGTPTSDLSAYVWPLVVTGLVAIPLGTWAFGRAERWAKRTGRLKRSG